MRRRLRYAVFVTRVRISAVLTACSKIVGELGKLVIEVRTIVPMCFYRIFNALVTQEIPLEQTQPGQSRALYAGTLY